MKKLTFLILLVSAFSFLIVGCGGGIQEGEAQKYYVADLVGDPNNRNILRATTVWNEDATFELLIPDYWEVKKDKEDKYNTDIYLTSDEYDNEGCVVLPGTLGYGVSEEYEIEQWYTLTPWGAADDYFFYERISDEERKPIMRVVQFTDPNENYYLFELRYPEEGDYFACDDDFSSMIATFDTLNTKLEETYIEEEIFQPKWTAIAIQNKGDFEDRIVIDYPPNWYVDRAEDDTDYLIEETYNCSLYVGVEDRDLSEAARYEEEVLVFDNNDMAKKYTLYDENDVAYMMVVTVTHDDIVYNFELRDLNDACYEDFEAMVTSFRTYAEEQEARKGTSLNEEEESGSGTTQE